MKTRYAFSIVLMGCLLQAPQSYAQQAYPDDPVEASATYEDVHAEDSLESFNRPVFSFNLGVDDYVVKPVSQAYHWIAPEPVRNGVSHVFENLSEPVNFINGVLQLSPTKAFSSFWRFALNSTFGLAGTFDFAGQYGNLPYQQNGFSQTLDHYGMPTGAYLVVPLLGPSTIRDTTGDVVDFVTDPFNYIIPTNPGYALDITQAIDTRDQNAVLVDELYYNALEPYVATRSAYLQNRSFQSRTGKTVNLNQQQP